MSNTSSRISQVFSELRSRNQLAFMPFLTAGDPDLAGMQQLIQAVSAAGADLIEIGFPYSDPIADGPVIQESYTRALAHRLTVDQIFTAISELPTDSLPPLVAMVSYAIIYRHGTQRFIDQARAAGFQGFIVPDLPTEEAAELAPAMQAAGLDLIQLIAPTTTPERAKQIIAHSSGFIYCIAVAGTTGARDQMAAGLIDQLRWLKTQTEIPLAVGFGISKPEHVEPLRGVADGAIVGSALVRMLQNAGAGKTTLAETVPEIQAFVQSMSQAAHQS